MDNKYFISIDIGTSYSKALLYSMDLNMVSESHEENKTVYPKPHHFEQYPEQWWESVKREIRDVISGIDPSDIVGIGTCAQMHAPILVDEKGRDLHPCLSWPDLRAVNEASEITHATGIHQPYYTGTAPKILWIKRSNPEAVERAYKILLPKDFIRMKLSNTFCTDINDARGTGMFDRERGAWMSRILDYIDIDIEKLPDPRPSEEIVGKVTREAAEQTGLREGTPVITGSSDNLGRTLDRRAASPRDILIYLGTGAMIEYISKSGTKPKGTYRSILGVAGSAPQWFKNSFVTVGSEEEPLTYEDLDAEAKKLEPGAGGLIFLPHLMGERAFKGRTRNDIEGFNPYARGVLYGLSLGHDRRHFFKAVREGAAYHLYLCWERIRQLNPGIIADRIVASGGGAQSRLWRQIIADVFNLPVHLPKITETGTLSVACLIAISLGMYGSFNEAIKTIDNPLIDVTEPILANVSKYRKMFGLYKKVEDALDEMFTSPNYGREKR